MEQGWELAEAHGEGIVGKKYLVAGTSGRTIPEVLTDNKRQQN